LAKVGVVKKKRSLFAKYDLFYQGKVIKNIFSFGAPKVRDVNNPGQA
jgi:hypothetical protein